MCSREVVRKKVVEEKDVRREQCSSFFVMTKKGLIRAKSLANLLEHILFIKMIDIACNTIMNIHNLVICLLHYTYIDEALQEEFRQAFKLYEAGFAL